MTATDVKFSDEDILIIQNTLMPEGTSVDEFNMFLKQCERTKLDPLSRQIYATRQGEQGKMIVGTTIDGFRLIAERTGKYGGQLGPYWCGEDGVWTDIWLKDNPPTAAKIGVIRTDWKEPLWATAKYKGYVQSYKDRKSGNWKLGPQWEKNPENQLAICAERLALRKAFPNDLGGLYGKEELGTESVEVETSPSGSLQESIEKQEKASGPVSSKGRGQGNRKPEAAPAGTAEPKAAEGSTAIPSGESVNQQPAGEVKQQAQESIGGNNGQAGGQDTGSGAAGTTDAEADTKSDTLVTVKEPTVTIDELMGLLTHGQRQGYTEEEISDWVIKTFDVTEDTILDVTKTQLAQAMHYFKTTKKGA